MMGIQQEQGGSGSVPSPRDASSPRSRLPLRSQPGPAPAAAHAARGRRPRPCSRRVNARETARLRRVPYAEPRPPTSDSDQHRGMHVTTPKEVLALAKQNDVEIVDLRFCDLPGLTQHFSVPVSELTEGVFEDGLGFDGSSIRGFQEIQESDMLLVARPGHRLPRPVHPAHHAEHPLLREGPGDRRVVLARPPLRRAQGRALPEADGHRRRLVLGSGGRVLHLRLDPLRPEPARGLLPHRCGRRRLELRRREERRRLPQPRLQAPLQGGLLPRAADGPLPGPPLPDGAEPREGRRQDRGAPSRGGHRRPGRDRHALRPAAGDRRQRHEVQVRRQEHGVGRPARPSRSCRSRSSRTTAPGCTPTRACGRTTRTCSGTRSATPASRTWPGGTSAACSSTRRRCSRSRTPRRTRSAGSCPATRRRSTSCTRSGTAAHASGSPCSHGSRPRSAWSSARRMRPATRTSRSARC